MSRVDSLHAVVRAAWVCLALVFPCAAFAAAHEDAADLLKRADEIKSSNNPGFLEILKRFDSDPTRLTPSQQAYLGYFYAWEDVYRGNYESAIPRLKIIADNSGDVTLRFRAGVTLVNSLTIAKHYEEAYARLNDLLEMAPRISDSYARLQGLGVAGLLYNQAGQYDLGISYADRLLSETRDTHSICKGQQLKLNALFKTRQTQAFGDGYQAAIDTCEQTGEFIFANLVRVDAAQLDIAQGRPTDAIRLLKGSEDEAQRTQYPRLTSAYDATLAQAYLQTDDTASAKAYAQRALAGSVQHEITEPIVDAYEVLYQAARKQGDMTAALEWHQKYATADKGYLTDTSARMLAFQMVKQQVLAKKLQIDALNKQNQVLQLQQAVSKKAVEARGLYLVMLLVVLGSIALYAYRTKRSQLKFMALARRDGLTGIFNRQHFIEASEQTLEYGAKSVRDACVIVIDLDHFKQINDEHGHAAGDLVLKRVVAACQLHLRSVDVFGRLGGEEFGILMPDCVPERATDHAEQMRVTIAEMAGFEDGPDFPVSASFGISAARWSGYNLRQLLAHADSALYQAKRDGRNRVVVYDHATDVGKKLSTGILDRRRG